MAWITIDPEAGIYHDESCNKHRYEDTGMTLAEQFPEWHFKAPHWVGVLLDITGRIHGRAQCIAEKYATSAQWPHTEGKG